MATHVLHAVARLQHRSGLIADAVEYTINVGFNAPPSLIDRVEVAETFAGAFFTTLFPGQVKQSGEYISDAISRAAMIHQVLVYETSDLTGQTPFGSPVASTNFSIGAVANPQELPEEVCSVISYHGDLTNIPVSEPNPTPPPVTVRPQQRRRGRLFFGPLNAAAGEESSNVFRPSAQFRTDMTLQFEGLIGQMASGTSGDLGVWSKADAEVYPVVGGFMDNAWDTQRRRGPVASARTLFAV